MNVYHFLTATYNQFVGIFPASIQWLVTLLILVGVIGVLISLVRYSKLFLIVVVLLVPFMLPVLVRFGQDVYRFITDLIQILHHTAPGQ